MNKDQLRFQHRRLLDLSAAMAAVKRAHKALQSGDNAQASTELKMSRLYVKDENAFDELRAQLEDLAGGAEKGNTASSG